MSEFIESLSITRVRFYTTSLQRKTITFSVNVGQQVRRFGFFLKRDEYGVMCPEKVDALEEEYYTPDIQAFRRKLDDHKISLFERLKEENSIRLPLLFEEMQ